MVTVCGRYSLWPSLSNSSAGLGYAISWNFKYKYWHYVSKIWDIMTTISTKRISSCIYMNLVRVNCQYKSAEIHNSTEDSIHCTVYISNYQRHFVTIRARLYRSSLPSCKPHTRRNLHVIWMSSLQTPRGSWVMMMAKKQLNQQLPTLYCYFWTSSPFQPQDDTMKIWWWYLLRFRSYCVVKQTNTQMDTASLQILSCNWFICQLFFSALKLLLSMGKSRPTKYMLRNGFPTQASWNVRYHMSTVLSTPTGNKLYQ